MRRTTTPNHARQFVYAFAQTYGRCADYRHCCRVRRMGCQHPYRTAIEFYNSAFEHYLITAPAGGSGARRRQSASFYREVIARNAVV